jgi:hypothetical protein
MGACIHEPTAVGPGGVMLPCKRVARPASTRDADKLLSL